MIRYSMLHREREEIKAIEFALYGPPAPSCLPAPPAKFPFCRYVSNERERKRIFNRIACEQYYINHSNS